MSFTPQVAEKAMLACGRHCCICHKFCGTKIETHHIQQRANGGDDSFENCIPLCFDCHADVGNYNPQHPKGRKFTVSELKSHRDNWYRKIESSELRVREEKYIDVDRELFASIREALRSDEIINFLKYHDLVLPTPVDALVPLREYLKISALPESEFLDATLEGLRAELNAAIESLTRYYAKVTFDERGREGWYRVPENWNYPDHKGEITWEQAQKTLAQLANNLCNAYDELIRQGRRLLLVN